MRRARLTLGIALLAASLAGGAHAAPEKVYTAPYEDGPSGGDEFNFVQGDNDSGMIAMGRLYLEPAVISCGGHSAYLMFRVTHKVTTPVSTVRVDYADALTDGYTWVALNVRDPKGVFIGAAELRGPLLQTGSIVTTLKPRPKRGTVLTIDAGMRMSSSCPGAGGGTLRIAGVVVS